MKNWVGTGLFVAIYLISFSIQAAKLEAVGMGKSVKVIQNGKSKNIEAGAELGKGDIVETDSESVADIRYENKSLVRIAKSSKYMVESNVASADHIITELLQGAVRILVPQSQDKKLKFELRTPQSVVGVRGTEFFVEESAGVTDLYMLHGEVDFAKGNTFKNAIRVSAGNRSQVKAKADPSKPEKFELSKLLERLDSASGLFGPLAERKHGFSAVASKEENLPMPQESNAKAKEVVALAKPKMPISEGGDKNLQFRAAVQALDLDKVKTLFDAGGIDLDLRDEHGNSYLHMAVSAEDNDDKIHVITFLATSGANPNAINDEKLSPLHVAIQEAESSEEVKPVISALLSYSANPKLKDKKGRDVLEYAKSRKFKDLEALLRKK